MNIHEKFMLEAINEAYKGIKTTFPNPAVGCVIVKDGNIIAKGYHHKAGMPHAEIEALKQIDFNAENCEMYVTLEPCNHFGKTPPCSEAIIKSKAKKVFISVVDPNPVVNGAGIKRLQSAGIEVETGILEKEGKELLKYFSHQIKYKKPFVTLKGAMSLNGIINKTKGERTFLTSPSTNLFTKELRNKYDFCLIGFNTLNTDNPKFEGCNVIILGGSKLDLSLNIFKNNKNIIHFSKETYSIDYENIKIINISENGIKIDELLNILYKEGVGSVFVEGGNIVFNQFIESGLFNELILYYTPFLFSTKSQTPFYNGNLESVDNLSVEEISKIENDLIVKISNKNNSSW